jgi:HlyD family secretion protein
VSNVISYDVVLDIMPAGVEFFPGMTANITITTASKDNVTKMPKAAFRFRPDQVLGKRANTPAAKDAATTVYKKGPAGQPLETKLVLGIADGRYSEVLSGDVQPGDQIIVSSTRVRK